MGPGLGEGWTEGKTLIDSMTDDIESGDGQVETRLERGTAVERYVVLYELGSGGMGVVYAAYDPELDRKVALKLLHAHTRSKRARTRLLREAKAIARLTHPNVVTVHDVGTFEGRVFVAMEYVHGLTFREWMVRAERSWSDVLAVLMQAGRGLAAAHKADLIHRDFKPDNILVEEGGRAVVLDFGLARRTDSREEMPDLKAATPRAARREENLTRTGAKLGTPAYMAPEQHLGTATDGRTDQFSFCVVLWEALYSERPFKGSTARETALSVLKGTITDPRSSDAPLALRRALQRGLSTDPDDRFGDMRTLLAALQRAPRRLGARWGAGAAMVVLGGLGFAVANSKNDAPTPVCGEAKERWTNIWDDATREQLEAVFHSSEAKFADAAWTGVEVALNRYTEQWASEHREACEATHVHHEQTEAMLDLRMACLRVRHRSVDALLREFEDADASVVSNAIEAVNALPRLVDCAEPKRLLGSSRAQQQPRSAADLMPLRNLLVDARAKETAARFEQAEALVARVLDDATAIGDHGVVAEAYFRAGSILERRSQFQQAEQQFLEAILAAQEAGIFLLEAKAWVRLVWVSGVERYDPQAGHLWARFARVALDRAGGDAILEARLTHNLGGVLYTERRFDEALERYRLALAEQTRLLGNDDPAVATTLNHIGNALMERHDYRESTAFCERSLTLRTRLFGEHHPKTAASLNNLGELEKKQLHAEQALGYATRSLAVVGGSGGREEEVGMLIAGWALRELGRPTEALSRFEQVRSMRAETGGADSERVVDVDLELAKTQAAAGNIAQAVALLERTHKLESQRRPEVAQQARSLRTALLETLGQEAVAKR